MRRERPRAEEFSWLGCNVLTVRPSMVIVAEGNPKTRRALLARGYEVHTFPASGSGSTGAAGQRV